MRARGKSATDFVLRVFAPCAMNLNSANRCQGADKTRNSVHLSTVANSRFVNQPWLIIESAGWLNKLELGSFRLFSCKNDSALRLCRRRYRDFV